MSILSEASTGGENAKASATVSEPTSSSQPNESQPIELGTVQQTLLTPLFARAREWNRPDAIVRDAKATELVSRLDYDFSTIATFSDTLTGGAIRAAILDRWVQEFLGRHPRGTVVLVGEGLDTTFDRNDNGQASWLEIDYPDVIAMRRQVFDRHPRRKQVGGSVFKPEWAEQIDHSGEDVLIQIAGVTMYLEPERVRELFVRLADTFPGCTVLFDTCSTLGKSNADRWEATVKTTGAEYRFGIDDPRTIADWDDRLVVTDCLSLMDHHRHRWTKKVRMLTTFWKRLRNSYLVSRAQFGKARPES
ncbi:MAG: class I SAM-dependent methyltransferase [Planctomycetota bacterium]